MEIVLCFLSIMFFILLLITSVYMKMYKNINVISKWYYSLIYLFGGVIFICQALTDKQLGFKMFYCFAGILFLAISVYYYKLRKELNIKK